MILSQGMNVKVCSFPQGEDPDSFAKQHSLEEINTYFDENTKDFLQFKAALLMEDAKNDPVKKAATIRAIVESIAKIPDAIQREVYVQSCADVMAVSESVLFSSLAQKLATSEKKQHKKHNQDKGLELVSIYTHISCRRCFVRMEKANHYFVNALWPQRRNFSRVCFGIF